MYVRMIPQAAVIPAKLVIPLVSVIQLFAAHLTVSPALAPAYAVSLVSVQHLLPYHFAYSKLLLGFHCAPDGCDSDDSPSPPVSMPSSTSPPPPPITTSTPPPPPPPITTSTPPPPPPPMTTSTPPPPPPSTPPPQPSPSPSTVLQSLSPSSSPVSQPSNPVVAEPSVTPQSSSQQTGFTNTSVSANDARISTSGPDWKNSTSSCDSTVPSKSNDVASETLTFRFNGKSYSLCLVTFAE